MHVAPRHALAGIGLGAVGHVLGEHVDDKQSVRLGVGQRQGVILAQARAREHADDLEGADVRGHLQKRYGRSAGVAPERDLWAWTCFSIEKQKEEERERERDRETDKA